MKQETWWMLSRMLNERAAYYNKIKDASGAVAYESAFAMVYAAIQDDIDTLQIYDHYGDMS